MNSFNELELRIPANSIFCLLEIQHKSSTANNYTQMGESGATFVRIVINLI
jgi:hypothetical protein